MEGRGRLLLTNKDVIVVVMNGAGRASISLHNVRIGACLGKVLLAAQVARVVGNVRAEEVVVLIGTAP